MMWFSQSLHCLRYLLMHFRHLIREAFASLKWSLIILYSMLTLVLLNPDIPCFANSVDPDRLATDLDLHCLPSSMQIYSNNVDQVT